MPRRWTEYEGKKICIGDFKEMAEDAYIQEIEALKQELLAGGHADHSVLLMTNCDAKTTEAISHKWKEFGEATAHLLKGSAIVGLTGFRRVMARLNSKESYFAKDDEDAKKYLAKQ